MLIIPIGEDACRLVDELQERINNEESFKSVLKKIGFYAINVYQYEYEKMILDNSIYELIDGIGVLQRLSIYSEDIGLYYEESDEATMI